MMQYALPLDEMTTAEKLRVMERIWEDLCRNPEDVPSPSWHAAVLHERELRVREGQETPIEWEDAKEQLRELL